MLYLICMCVILVKVTAHLYLTHNNWCILTSVSIVPPAVLIEWQIIDHSSLSSSTVQQLEPARICEHSNVLFHTIVEKSWTSLVMVSIIMKLYSTIVLTMNTGKYPICVCLCYWPWAQSQANVTPMLLHRDAITQDWSVCQSNELCRTHWRGRQLNEKCHNFTEFQSGKGQLIFSKLHKTTLSTYRNNVAVNTLWKYSYMRGLGEVLQVPPFPPPPLLHPFSFCYTSFPSTRASTNWMRSSNMRPPL